MFKKIWWTFSIYSLNFLFLIPTVSMSVFTAGYCGYSQWLCQVKATRHEMTLKSLALPATSVPCKLNMMCSAVEVQMATQGRTLEQVEF